MKKITLFLLTLLLFVVFNNSFLSLNKKIVFNHTYLEGNTTNTYMKIQMTSSTTSSSGYTLTPYTSNQSIGVMRQNSLNLQQALDDVSNNGGGEVILPSGTFYFALTGVIFQTEKMSDGTTKDVGPIHGNETYAVRLRNNVLLRGQGSSTILRQYNVIDTNRTGKYSVTTSQTGDPGIDMFFYNAYKEAKFPSATRTALGSSSFNYDTTKVTYSYYRLKSAVNTAIPSESDYELVQETHTVYLINADFKDFIIDGTSNSANGYTTSGKAFMVNLFKDCDWENVTVRNINATGFGMDAPVDSTIKNCKAINCGKQARINMSSNLERAGGASGFGIGTGASNNENILIENCEAYNNAKFGFFFEHQGRFKSKVTSPTIPQYQATTSTGFVVKDSVAGGNMYDFGGLQADDVIYDNVTSYSGKTRVDESNSSSQALNSDNYNPAKYTLFTKQSFFINSNFHGSVTDFSSVDENLKASRWVVDNGILDVEGGKNFNKNSTMTRFEVLLTLYKYNNFRREAGLTTLVYSPVTYAKEIRSFFSSIFTDVGNITISGDNGTLSTRSCFVQRDLDTLKWAYTKEILQGSSNNTADYNSNCTRLQFITFLYRLAGNPDVATHGTVFTDVPVTNKPVYWALENGITKGAGSNAVFSPNDDITKEQVALFLYRYNKDINKVRSFKIDYYKMGGSWNSGEAGPSSYAHGTTVTLNKPKKTGYTFSGWRGTGLSSNTQTVTISTSSYGDRVYYSVWTPITYSISYSDKGTLTNQPTSGTYSQTVGIDNPTKKVTVSFNKGDSNATIAAPSGNSNTSCSYTYNGWSTTIPCNYTFNGWDITGMDSTTHNYGTSISTATSLSSIKETAFKNLRSTSGTVTFTGTWTPPTIALPIITKTGYICKWTSPTSTGTLEYASDGTYKPAASGGVTSRTFTAECSPNTYQVKFNANGGSGTMSNETFTYDVSKNLTTNSFTRTGYSFNGWNTKADGTGTNYSNGQSVSNLTSTNNGIFNLYAKWKANTYTLTYNNQSGSGCSTKTGTYDSTWGTLCTPTRTGYTFGGWYTEANGAGTKVTATTTVTGNLTVYAKWTAYTYQVKFNSNGGTGTMANQSFTYDVQQALTANSFTRAGYTFAGWNTKADGTGTNYSNQESVSNLTSTNNGTITLYAKWAEGGYEIVNYQVVDDYIFIGESTTFNSYKNHFNFSSNSYSIKIFKGNTELSSTASIPNGSTTKVYLNNVFIDSYINIVMGDFNENGEVTIADVSKLYTYVSNTYSIPEYTQIAGDYNKNGRITIADVSGLYTYIQNK